MTKPLGTLERILATSTLEIAAPMAIRHPLRDCRYERRREESRDCRSPWNQAVARIGGQDTRAGRRDAAANVLQRIPSSVDEQNICVPRCFHCRIESSHGPPSEHLPQPRASSGCTAAHGEAHGEADDAAPESELRRGRAGPGDSARSAAVVVAHPQHPGGIMAAKSAMKNGRWTGAGNSTRSAAS